MFALCTASRWGQTSRRAVWIGRMVRSGAMRTSRPTSSGLNVARGHLGIYELDGDTVQFYFSAPGQNRPTDFTAQAGGEGWTSSAWKREKK